MFANCPHRWEIQQSHKEETTTPALFLGSTFHLVQSQFQSAKLAGIELSLEETLETFIMFFQKQTAAKNVPIEWGNDTPERQMNLGLEITKTYYPYAQSLKPSLVEEHAKRQITMESGEIVELFGTIDLVTTDFKVIDYKTASFMPYRSEIVNSLQPTCYLFLMEHVLPFEFHYVMKWEVPEVRIVPVKKTINDLMFLERRLLPYAVDMIHKGVFPPFGFANARCRWCPQEGRC
jgi:hypothetical protein